MTGTVPSTRRWRDPYHRNYSPSRRNLKPTASGGTPYAHPGKPRSLLPPGGTRTPVTGRHAQPQGSPHRPIPRLHPPRAPILTEQPCPEPPPGGNAGPHGSTQFRPRPCGVLPSCRRSTPRRVGLLLAQSRPTYTHRALRCPVPLWLAQSLRPQYNSTHYGYEISPSTPPTILPGSRPLAVLALRL